jgi:hypothetical protein
MNTLRTCQKDILALTLFEDNWRTGASRLQHDVTCVGSCSHSDIVCLLIQSNCIELQSSIDILIFSITLHYIIFVFRDAYSVYVFYIWGGDPHTLLLTLDYAVYVWYRYLYKKLKGVAPSLEKLPGHRPGPPSLVYNPGYLIKLFQLRRVWKTDAEC